MDTTQEDAASRILEVTPLLIKWGVLGSMVLGLFEVSEKNISSPKRISCTLLDLVLMIFAALSATAAAVKCYIYVIAEFLLNEGEMLQKVLEEMAVCISLMCIGVISVYRQREGLPASGFVCATWGLLFTASSTDVLTWRQTLDVDQYALLSDSCSSVGILTANVVIMLLTLGGFLYSSLQDRLVYSRTSGKFERPLEEDLSSPFAKYVSTAAFRAPSFCKLSGQEVAVL